MTNSMLRHHDNDAAHRADGPRHRSSIGHLLCGLTFVLAACGQPSADTHSEQVRGVQKRQERIPELGCDPIEGSCRYPAPVEVPRTRLEDPPPGFTLQQVVGMRHGSVSCPRGNEHYEPIEGLQDLELADGRGLCSYRFRHSGREPKPEDTPIYCPPELECCATNSCPGEATPGTGWLEPDDDGLYAAALPSAATRVVARALRQQHRAAMGNPSRYPEGGTYFTELPRKVRVFVLDDSSDDDPGVHGDAVAHWIRETACPDDGDCGLWIEKRKVIRDRTGDAHGPVVGLAAAIRKAVDDAGKWPAVINLSLQLSPTRVFEAGFQPNSGDDISNHDFRFAHRQLLAALHYARCHGVPVVASAGNTDGGPDPHLGFRYWGENLAYPAAASFPQVHANPYGEQWACEDGSIPSRSRGLAIAAGAIQADGTDAPSVRERGQSCLVAPSTGLTADGLPLEGSSFSAASTTGAIASVWRYAPKATGYEVVEMLQQTAERVPSGPRKVPCQNGGDAKRYNICKGMLAALDTTCELSAQSRIYGFACAMKTDLKDNIKCHDISVGAMPTLSSKDGSGLLAEVTKPGMKLKRTYSVQPEGGYCEGDVLADLDYRNPRLCPEQKKDNGTPDAAAPGTSPGGIGCGGCSTWLVNDGSAWQLWFYGSLVNETVASPTVNVRLRNPAVASSLRFTSSATEQDDGELRIFELGEVLKERDVDQEFAVLLSEDLGELLGGEVEVEEATFSFEFVEEDGATTAHVGGLPVIQTSVPAESEAGDSTASFVGSPIRAVQ